MNEVATAAFRGHAGENRGTVIRTTTDNEQSTAISFASINANWRVSASISRATVFDVCGPGQIGCMNLADIRMDVSIRLAKRPFLGMIGDGGCRPNYVRSTKAGGHIAGQYRRFTTTTLR